MVGGESSFLEMILLRRAYIWQDNSEYYLNDLEDDTYGPGIAIPYRRFLLRFDYAYREFARSDTHKDSYGLVFDAAF